MVELSFAALHVISKYRKTVYAKMHCGEISALEWNHKSESQNQPMENAEECSMLSPSH